MPAIASERPPRRLRLPKVSFRPPAVPPLHKPRWTLRLRLTLLYGGLFLVAGTVLLAITYGLVAGSNQTKVSLGPNATFVVSQGPRLGPDALPPKQLIPRGVAGQLSGGAVKFEGNQQLVSKLTRSGQAQLNAVRRKAATVIAQQHSDQLNSLLTRSGIALAIMAFTSIGLGWLMAGRALRPLRTMNTRARGITERNLHERLALDGPDDELTELGRSFDGLLSRLETAFESQRRFVANASHELRTPVTVSRTLVEVALGDPEPSVESLQTTCRKVLAAGEQQERTIEALLILARSQRGIESQQPVDLAGVARLAIDAAEAGQQSDRPAIEAALAPAEARGDSALLERMAANLIDNAINHNVAGGFVRVQTSNGSGPATLKVTNSGPMIAPERVPELFEPFRRLEGRRADGRGLGLGLSIVDAIAVAHGARVRATPRSEGGLEVEVSFPERVSRSF